MEKVTDMEKISQTLNLIKSKVYEKVADLDICFAFSKEPLSFSEAKKAKYESIKIGERWGGLFDCSWFRFNGKVPVECAGENIVLLIDINGEACIVDETDGTPLRGLTNISSEFDRSLGLPGKRVYNFSDCAKGGENVSILMDGACNDLFGKYCGGYINQAEIAVCNNEIRALYYDYWVLNDLLKALDETSERYITVKKALIRAAEKLVSFDKNAIAESKRIVSEELSKKNDCTDLVFTAIGHAHLDLAWLWPIRETKRKAERTFATLLDLLDKYPDYLVGMSQPQQFEWIKTRQPKLYAKIKEKVKEKRIEPQGIMWCEPDLNVTGGESLIRQIIYGKRFFKKEFDYDVKVCHLPDVFGFNGALPQILKKTGTDYLITIKISWNKYNKFPYHTFNWMGIDGSTVLTHMPPEGTYNSPISPSSIKTAEKKYAEKGVCGEAVILYGIGDGGGGPGREHLERLSRQSNLSGICPVESGFTDAFFERISKNKEKYPTYKGELYLEKHQGTYTTQGKIKYFNRKIEFLLRECELLYSAAMVLKGEKYPSVQLEKIWKEILLYQFHDILPGTSIKRVYDECFVRYAVLEAELTDLISTAKNALGGMGGFYNSLNFERTETVERAGEFLKAVYPPMSADARFYKLPKNSLSCGADYIENEFLRAEINEHGELSALINKKSGKNTIAGPSNILSVFTDTGDAWDMSEGYLTQNAGSFKVVEKRVYMAGKFAVVEQKFVFGDSVLNQKIKLDATSEYLTFENEIDWKERQKLLRAVFTPETISDIVNCSIQFGNFKRSTLENNSIEKAQEEICAQKYVDISDSDCGIALINDCKYGHRIKNGKIMLTLLRGTDYPGENGDYGSHSFKYALYPHTGSFEKSDVAEQSYCFNLPLICGVSFEFIDFVKNTGIILETVKKAEDSENIILRLYESKGLNGSAELKLRFNYSKLYETTMDENIIRELNDLKLEFLPFEIKTIMIRR